jgi:hypothetical protein
VHHLEAAVVGDLAADECPEGQQDDEGSAATSRSRLDPGRQYATTAA